MKSKVEGAAESDDIEIAAQGANFGLFRELEKNGENSFFRELSG